MTPTVLLFVQAGAHHQRSVRSLYLRHLPFAVLRVLGDHMGQLSRPTHQGPGQGVLDRVRPQDWRGHPNM